MGQSAVVPAPQAVLGRKMVLLGASSLQQTEELTTRRDSLQIEYE